MLVLTNQNNFSRYSIWEVLLFLATHIVPRAAVETVQYLNFKLDIHLKNIVEKIQEDRLDSIPSPSPSVKIQIFGGIAYLRQ